MLGVLRWNADHAGAIAGNDIAWAHADAAAANGLIAAVMAMWVRPVSGVIRRASTGRRCEHFLSVAHPAVDHSAGKAPRFGGQPRQAAERGHALAGIVDDEMSPARAASILSPTLKSSARKSPRSPLSWRTVTA